MFLTLLVLFIAGGSLATPVPTGNSTCAGKAATSGITCIDVAGSDGSTTAIYINTGTFDTSHSGRDQNIVPANWGYTKHDEDLCEPWTNYYDEATKQSPPALDCDKIADWSKVNRGRWYINDAMQQRQPWTPLIWTDLCALVANSPGHPSASGFNIANLDVIDIVTEMVKNHSKNKKVEGQGDMHCANGDQNHVLAMFWILSTGAITDAFSRR